MALFRKKQNSPGRRSQPSRPEPQPDLQDSRFDFRRNRTITGSASSRVRSTGEENAQLKSERVQAHELVKKRRSVGVLFLMIFLAGLSLFLLIHQFTASAAVRSDDVTRHLDNELYEDTIQSYFADHPAERLRFLANNKTLTDFVQTAHPEVLSVTVGESAGFGKSYFEVVTRAPIAGWKVNGRQQYVDKSGVSFERNYDAEPGVSIVDKSGIPVTAGQAVASNRFLGFVGLVVGLSKAQGYTVTSVIIPEYTTRQVQLQVKDIPYQIKFSIDRKAGEQVEDMIKAITWFKAKGIAPEYLDVRVSGKASYKS